MVMAITFIFTTNYRYKSKLIYYVIHAENLDTKTDQTNQHYLMETRGRRAGVR